jgi:predicted deacetylase
MSSAEARYLLRFDDLCPTMSKERFERFLVILHRHRIRPILAVVPDNQDPELRIDYPDPEFWSSMRALEADGATIAMHGYRHLCQSSGPSLLGLHSQTEFAGVAEDKQREWIHSGLEILRGNGLCPRLFVAPRHGFDSATLRALAEEGLGFLSDGFASRPFTRNEVVWIPQQLWEPVKKSRGLWTICLHTNTATPDMEQKLDLFLHEHAVQFTSFDRVIDQQAPQELHWSERIGEAVNIRRSRPRSA